MKKQLPLLMAMLCLTSISVLAQQEKFTELFRPHGDFNLEADKAIFFNENEILMVTTSKYQFVGPFWYTINQGKTWKNKAKHPFKLRFDDYFAYDLKHILVNDDSLGFLMSSDSGLTFNPVNGPGIDTWNDMVIIDGVFYANSRDGSYISRDSLKTFEELQFMGPFERLVGKYRDYIVTTNDFGGYRQSYDGGKTWHGFTMTNKQLRGEYKRMITDSIMYAWDRDVSKGLSWTFDRGQSMTTKAFPEGTQWINDMLFINRSIGYAIFNDSFFYKTYNGGETWDLKHDFDLQLRQIDTAGQNTVFVHTLGYRTFDPLIYVSNNGGEFVSIDEMKLKKTTVYPNPAHQSITISLEESLPTVYTLFDLQGQMIESGRTEQRLVLDVSNLNNGFYFIRLESDNGVATHKVQVIH